MIESSNDMQLLDSLIEKVEEMENTMLIDYGKRGAAEFLKKSEQAKSDLVSYANIISDSMPDDGDVMIFEMYDIVSNLEKEMKNFVKNFESEKNGLSK